MRASCALLGACLAFRGVEARFPFCTVHRGCATGHGVTISHFKEPLDIASSNFGETTAAEDGRCFAEVRRGDVQRLLEVANHVAADVRGQPCEPCKKGTAPSTPRNARHAPKGAHSLHAFCVTDFTGSGRPFVTAAIMQESSSGGEPASRPATSPRHRPRGRN